jgi:hypothetical protein
MGRKKGIRDNVKLLIVACNVHRSIISRIINSQKVGVEYGKSKMGRRPEGNVQRTAACHGGGLTAPSGLGPVREGAAGRPPTSPVTVAGLSPGCLTANESSRPPIITRCGATVGLDRLA